MTSKTYDEEFEQSEISTANALRTLANDVSDMLQGASIQVSSMSLRFGRDGSVRADITTRKTFSFSVRTPIER